MNISMWILQHALSDYETIPIIQSGEMCISNIQTFSATTEFSSDTVYLGKASDYFVASLPENDLLLSNKNDILIVLNADIDVVFNYLVRVFTLYHNYNSRINAAYYEQNSYQAVLDVVHDMFQCPMFFGHKDLRIYAITEQYTDEDCYEGWDQVKTFKTVPINLMKTHKAPDMEKYPDSLDSVAIPAKKDDGKNFTYQIRNNVYCHNELWGHLYIYYNRPTVHPSVLQLARHAANVFSRLLDHTQGKPSSRFEEYSYLVELLDGQNVASDIISSIQYRKGLDGKLMYLCKIAPIQVQRGSIFLEHAINNIIENATNELVFPYQNNIIIVGQHIHGKEQPPLLRYVQYIFDIDAFSCGVSFPFYDLNNLPIAYFQASYAITKQGSPTNKLCWYDDVSFPGVLDYFKQTTTWKLFADPRLFILIHHDSKYGTEYFKTLFCFLINNMQINSAAKQLFIHRNTMKYRLEKIQDLASFNFEDEETYAYLRFCYGLMIEEFPFTLPEKPDGEIPEA